MKLKAVVEKEEFFNKLIKHKCKFKRVCGVYPANCNKVKYIGQLKNFKEMEVFELNSDEVEFFRTLFKIFKDAEIKIDIRNGDGES